MKIGIIGGSGMDDPKILENYNEITVDTPFGLPSSFLTTGNIDDKEICIIARHNKDHSIMPTKVPYHANIWALKEKGCTHILATTACGSLREQIKPGDFVFLDQFIDFTKHRILTFHEDKVIHTPMADPFDSYLRMNLIQMANQLNYNFHNKGTMVTIEGPRFSTRAESHMFRSLGADVINMSTVPEVILANEVDISYQAIAMATDYDCWKEGEDPVTLEMVYETMAKNAEKVTNLLVQTIKSL